MNGIWSDRTCLFYSCSSAWSLVSIVTKRFVRHWWSPELAKSGLRSTIGMLTISGLFQNLANIDWNGGMKKSLFLHQLFEENSWHQFISKMSLYRQLQNMNDIFECFFAPTVGDENYKICGLTLVHTWQYTFRRLTVRLSSSFALSCTPIDLTHATHCVKWWGKIEIWFQNGGR